MSYNLEPQPGDRRAPGVSPSADDSAFRVSPEPVVENGNDPDVAAEASAGALPDSYGSHAVYLMARDPHSLFAYWDIDWAEAFREHKPHDRKVHLRITRADGSEETALEVEPMAGSCYVDVTRGDEEYTAEIGYYRPADVWNSVATSAPVATPPDSLETAEAPDFATVPFHLSFQRMIDLFRVSKYENASLTSMLADLRERANTPDSSSAITDAEREIVHAIDEAVARGGESQPAQTGRDDLWVQQGLERILGFGRSGTSPQGGFGGSS